MLGMAVVELSVRSCVWLTWFAGRVVKIGVRILTSPVPAPVLPSLCPLCFHMCWAADGCYFLCPGHQGSWTSLPPDAVKSFLLYCCCCSVAQSRATLCDPMDCSMPGLHVSHHLPKSAQVHAHCIGDAIQPSHPLTHSPPALNLSPHQGLSDEPAVPIRWPKCWSFSFSISPSNEYSGLISLQIDWIDLLAVQETLRSLL